jgi:hypothetical protein
MAAYDNQMLDIDYQQKAHDKMTDQKITILNIKSNGKLPANMLYIYRCNECNFRSAILDIDILSRDKPRCSLCKWMN